jgi:hypothetical protein
MQSAFDIQSTFLNFPSSTTSRYTHLPHNVLELRRAETTISACSHQGAHLQAAQVKHFPENHDIVEQSACQVADRGL